MSSFDQNDSQFVDKLYSHLKNAGAIVYLDRHDMVAGDLQKQIAKQIQIKDVVIIVLSKDSIDSDWVEAELEMAWNKEKKENRDVLCPVMVDDCWKDKQDDVLWRQLKRRYILDFTVWQTEEFDTVFNKLINGIKKNYIIIT